LEFLDLDRLLNSYETAYLTRPQRISRSMTVYEILDVSRTGAVSTRLRGCNIDTVPGSKTGGHLVQFWGWVLGRESPAVAVELLHGTNDGYGCSPLSTAITKHLPP